MSQPPNLGMLLSRSKFVSQHKNHKVKNCRNDWVSCHYSLYQPYINLNFFLPKISINFECSNSIYVVISQGCKEKCIKETSCLVKGRINIYKQHIRQPQYQQLAVEENLHT